MPEFLEETIIDSLKLLPFLFVAFLLIELFEHKFKYKAKNFASKSGKLGPIIGSILGIIPQCGFSVIGANLYVTRIITLGTLMAIFLSTSDEMLPILIASGENIVTILIILLIKLLVAVVFGFIIDAVIRKPKKVSYHICNEDHCHCDESILKSSIIHTVKTFIFIFIITLVLNYCFDAFGEEFIQGLFRENNVLAPFLTALIGLIPNCAPSVLLTELYLNNILSLGGAVAGLLSASGVGLLVLFKSNNDMKENIKIATLLYSISVFTGLLIEVIEAIV